MPETPEQPEAGRRGQQGPAQSLKRLLLWATLAITAAAIVQQLRRPREERTWHGAILGVPYDFRRPSLRRFLDAWWNPREPRMFLPRDFGVGWSINLHHALLILFGPNKYLRPAEETADEEG